VARPSSVRVRRLGSIPHEKALTIRAVTISRVMPTLCQCVTFADAEQQSALPGVALVDWRNETGRKLDCHDRQVSK
jgi:hypothetical protein